MNDEKFQRRLDAWEDRLAQLQGENEALRADLEGHKKANAQLKEDLRLEGVSYSTLRARLEGWQERAARNQGETIRLLREKALLEQKLVRAHGILDALWPESDANVDQIKKWLLQDVHRYLAASGVEPLLGLLAEGEILTLEHGPAKRGGGRAKLVRFGEVIAIGSEAVEALLSSRSHNATE